MSNLNKANSVAHEWVESMGGLESIRHDHGSDLSGLMQALEAAGLLAPDLPDPMQPWEAERTGGTPGSRWYGYEDDGNDDGSGMYSPHRYVDAYPGEVWIDWHVLLSPEGAKAYALAILAAANHAEKEQEHG